MAHRSPENSLLLTGMSLAAFFFFASTQKITATTQDISLTLEAPDQKISLDASTVQSFIRLETVLTPSPRSLAEIENTHYCPKGKTLYCTFALSRHTRETITQTFSIRPEEHILRQYLESLAKTLDQPATDPSFAVENGRVKLFALGKDGQAIDIDQNIRTITDALMNFPGIRNQTISLIMRPIAPDITSGDPGTLGINELIGIGTTDFRGSPKNRVHNFTRGMEQFNGLLIKPGEEFSFVEHLGEVDAEHGYLPELVIKNNETIPEFGGGICQVSSTMFRAALYSGLPITERRNHAYAVQYYQPIGMDATVYIPRPDLKFINNTPGYILIQGKIEGTKFIFQFYGTSDGRKTEIDGPHIVERLENGGLRTILSQKVTAADGTPMHQTDFRSKYAPASLFPHPGQEPIFTDKPDDWSTKQWVAYQKTR